MNRNHLKILTKLNSGTIFCEFQISCNAESPVTCFEAEYFGYEIKIISIETVSNRIVYAVFLEDWLNSSFEDCFINYENEHIYKSLDHVITAVNNFIRQRPFAIQRFARGCYQLLDPNGFDYIGQFVTKNDAVKTCKAHYVYRQ